ncbi:lipid droplet biogenesis associated protein seipin isoform X1 [Leptinotarsa decemlineata]|uniref:lipid droplet biogenesis associated protein seipin isoform X1 n=1 Tax=Leptinotarsa decemlineata TaxID=7539 RepID=UPI000C253727|nr:seipin isoform X2 [Leptinotarsa decemlineata]
MLRILSSIGCFLRLGPRQYIRQKFKIPLVKFIHDTIDLYKSRTKAGVNNVREILFRGTVVALITALLVWLSILMYVAFYYVYVPTISHERPVFLKFKPCGATDNCIAEKGICSFPSAHVQLTERQQLLMIGQPYKIHLDLEMPESPKNRELGMFMVCVEFIGRDGTLVEHSCRSTMLHYRGILLDTLYKLVFSPFFLFGSAEEKQTVQVELFSNFEDNDYEPVTDIFVEVQSRFIEIYSAKFSVNAQFAGLRYIMFHWPVLSAALGITANLFFIALVCLISWYQILHSEEYLEFMESSRIKQRESDSDSSNFVDYEEIGEDPNFKNSFNDLDEDLIENLQT